MHSNNHLLRAQKTLRKINSYPLVVFPFSAG